MLDLVEVLTGEAFLHFTFEVFAKEFFSDDGANWMNLSCLQSGSGARVSVVDSSGFWLICTLGSLQWANL